MNNIVHSVITQAASGAGNVILLHDGGGDRTQTIAALPLIIQQLRARGYQLVTVSDLIGLSRDQVMPVIPPGERFLASFNNLGFQATRWHERLSHDLLHGRHRARGFEVHVYCRACHH